MKKILSVLCVGILSIGILGGCTSNNNSSNEIAKLNSELESTTESLVYSKKRIDMANEKIEDANKKIEELEKEVEIKNRALDLKEGTRECIDDEELQWLKIEDWDKITIRNRVTNEKVEIKGEDLPNGFTLYSSLESLITYQNIVREGRDSPKKTEFYKYEFFKDDDKYEINIWADDIGQFIDNQIIPPNYYKSSNLKILGDSFAPPTEYQYTENILNKIYNSGFIVSNYHRGSMVNNTEEHIINPSNSKEIAKWIVSEISKGVLKKVNEVPNINFEWETGATAYWHGEKININLYNDGDVEYIEIINNEETVIYKDTEPYSMGGFLN